MITEKDIDSCVSYVTAVPVQMIHSKSKRRPVCDARNLAMLKCQEYLKLSTLKLMIIYDKESHTTIMSDLKSAKNYIETSKKGYIIAAKVDQEIAKVIKHRRSRKRLADFHYRIRKKGFIINTRSKTVSIPINRTHELEGRLLQNINKRGYNIQYSII